MSDPNFVEQAGAFAADAGIDTAADGVINNVVDAVASHIPGGETLSGVLKTGLDLAANNAINSEVNEGAGGMLGAVEGLFSQHNSET